MGAVLAFLLSAMKNLIGYVLGTGTTKKRKPPPATAEEIRALRLKHLTRIDSGGGGGDKRAKKQRIEKPSRGSDDTSESTSSSHGLRRRRKGDSKVGKSEGVIYNPLPSSEESSSQVAKDEKVVENGKAEVRAPMEVEKNEKMKRKKQIEQTKPHVIYDPKVSSILSEKISSKKKLDARAASISKKEKKKAKTPEGSQKKKKFSRAFSVASDTAASTTMSEADVIMNVLRVSNDAHEAKRMGYELISVETISIESLDLVLFHILENIEKTTQRSVFNYLISSYRRILEIREKHPKIAATVLKTLTSYIFLCLTPNNELFHSITYQISLNAFVRLLTANSALARSLPPGLFASLCADFQKEISSLARPIIDNLMPSGRTFTLDSVAPVLRGFKKLASSGAAVICIATHPRFFSGNKDGASIESDSLLGPLLSVTAKAESGPFERADIFQPSSFRSIETDCAKIIDSIQDVLALVFKRLLSPKVNKLESDTDVRQRILGYVEKILALNLSRRKLRFDPTLASSDGFVANLGGILTRLCLPFTSGNKKGSKLLDIRYTLSESARVQYKDETLLAANENEKKKIQSEIKTSTSFGLVSEMTFMSLECLHIGYIAETKALQHTKHQIWELQHALNAIGGPHSSDPMAGHIFGRLKRMMNKYHASRARLLAPGTVRAVAALYSYICENVLKLSISKDSILAVLPEYILADIVDFWVFFSPNFRDLSLGESWYIQIARGTLDMAIYLLRKDSMVKNPHLKGKLPGLIRDILEQGSSPSIEPKAFSNLQTSSASWISVGKTLVENCTMRDALLPNLVDLYVQIESGENQFYGKFQTRYVISEILKLLWPHKKFQKDFQTLETAKLLRFVNMLANDAIWLLDESLKNLEDIHKFQEEFPDIKMQNAMRNPAEAKRLRELQRTERGCKSLMSLANASIDLVHLISNSHVDPFVDDIMTERMAQMVGYYLNKLNTKQVSNLKVKDPKKYNFRPRILLRHMIGIFINLSVSRRFLQCVAEDERSYDHKVFTRAVKAARAKKIVRENQIAQFESLLMEVQSIAQSSLEAGEEDPIPDKYLDPLMATLMRNPVRLPSSRMIMDKAVIMRHLLNAETDPFNRKKLSPEMLEELPEFRKEIEDYLQKREMKRKGRKGKPADGKNSTSSTENESGMEEKKC
mmetsp:Transcript_17879/g.26763  ORF Transcript_17879/g.26763 Transcript_17879/m.26763 type:complete len:1164 (+) Transcript_17879:31-3522(+)